ncbi:MAG: DUF1385 domain-containing protein [Firmicutes bacterium]|jgi:uncharacterized protein YqhQ|nr:DUF1385 domain-containing protein [Bacillota bacterium]MDD4336203.1 DUF1385 domain-containing protein [Bacillota bacterium]MDD4792772.1 DUF1385 domain-containing protein [Bacillota bacterium]
MSPRYQYGGQAVIEGVMMRGRDSAAIAVRRPDGDISIKMRDIDNTKRPSVLKAPFIRGVVMLVESLVLGMESLMYSANESSEEEEQLSGGEVVLSLLMAFGLFVLLFIVVPNVIVAFMQKHIPNVVLVNLLEGILRIVIFLVYIVVISKLEDIQRVFAYHGAEHKTIAAWEAGEELTVDNARKHSTLHPRCGTNFLLIVMVLAVFVYSLLGKQTLGERILSRLILLPVVAGLSYEVLKLVGRPNPSPFIQLLSAPGLALQNLTTRQPDDSMLEVAIASLTAVIEKDQAASDAAVRQDD